MLKLNSEVAKVFVSRDGRIAIYVDPQDDLPWFISGRLGEDKGYTWKSEGEAVAGDWLPVDMPKFPKLPRRPSLVYARTKHLRVAWWMLDGCKHASHAGCCVHISLLEVVPHPDNDPEAVLMIEEAKR